METGLHIFVASATARGILAAALALVCMPAFALDAGDTLLFGNKDWRNGGNPGIALCAAKRTENVKTPGVVFNCIGAGEHRLSGGEMQVVEAGRWVPLTESQGTNSRRPAVKVCVKFDETGKRRVCDIKARCNYER